jgi:hypothetical protein
LFQVKSDFLVFPISLNYNHLHNAGFQINPQALQPLGLGIIPADTPLHGPAPALPFKVTTTIDFVPL